MKHGTEAECVRGTALDSDSRRQLIELHESDVFHSDTAILGATSTRCRPHAGGVNLTRLILILTTMMFGAMPALAQRVVIREPFCTVGTYNLVANGGFESGLSGWQAAGQFGNFALGAGLVGASGAQTHTIATVSGPGYAIIRNVPVTPGRTYVMSGYFNTGQLAGGFLYLDLNDVAWEPGPPAPFRPSIRLGMLADIGVSGWQFVYEPVTIPNGVSQVTIRVVRDGGCIPGEIANVDEVAFTPIELFTPPVAAPAIRTGPAPVFACRLGTSSFNVVASGMGPFTYRWQHETAVNNWVDTGNGPLPYAFGAIVADGVTTDRLQLNLDVQSGSPPLRFRCVVTNSCRSTTTEPVTLSFCLCLACSADFNEDGGVDGEDMNAFFNAWEDGSCDGDVNQDGGVDGDDVGVFFSQWENGGC